MLCGEFSVADLALPALPNTCDTSGTVLMILSCTCKSLFASELETSGKVTGINSNEPSSNGGMNSEPKRVIIIIPTVNATKLIPIVVLRHFKPQFNLGF